MKASLVLASASRVRLRLLRDAGLEVEARPSLVDEAAVKQAYAADDQPPEAAAIALAEMKAERVSRADPAALVIGADQILVCEGRWFDKPEDSATVGRQLRQLRGRQHVLVTVVVCYRGGVRLWHHIARPVLTMRAFTDSWLDAYVQREGEAVLGCVGGYRLEAIGAQLFDTIEGDFFSVLGLPLLPLLGFLRQHGALAE